MKPRNFFKYFIFIFLFLTFAKTGYTASHILINTSGKNYTPPLIIHKKNGEKSGIIPDILELLAERTDSKTLHLPIRRDRLDNFIRLNRTDITCHTTPKWMSSDLDVEFIPVYQSADVYVISKHDNYNFKDPAVLSTLKIGAIKNFKYDVVFMTAINHGAQHILAKTNNENWIKLNTGKLNAMIVTDLIAQHQLTNPHYADRFKIVSPTTKKHWRYCAIRKSHPIYGMISKTLHMMREDGDIQKILNKYSPKS